MLIQRQEKSAHWYLKTGEPFYTIEAANGSGPRPVRITDAFKAGAYRSVTNVLSILAKPGLDLWKNEQCVLSALTLPRVPGETDHQFAERAMKDSEEQAKKAAAAGTRLHELAAGWLINGTIPAPESEVRLLEPFQAWCHANLNPVEPLAAVPETVMLNHEYGYAGRADLPVKMADGSIAIVDLKTVGVARDKKTNVPRPVFYDEWAMQLAAYSRGIFSDGSYPPPMSWRCISIIIDRTEPGLYAKEWSNTTDPLASMEKHFRGFVAACNMWSYLRGGTPGIDLKKAA